MPSPPSNRSKTPCPCSRRTTTTTRTSPRGNTVIRFRPRTRDPYLLTTQPPPSPPRGPLRLDSPSPLQNRYVHGWWTTRMDKMENIPSQKSLSYSLLVKLLWVETRGQIVTLFNIGRRWYRPLLCPGRKLKGKTITISVFYCIYG